MTLVAKVGPNGTVTIADLKPLSMVRIVVKQQRPQRSGRQNNYYWGVVLPTLLADHRFKKWTDEQLHDALKEKFLSHLDPVTGLMVIGSTTDNDTLEQEAYHDRIKQWAAETLDVYIPDPNEQAA
jgi:hypothetical protein